MAGGKSDGLTNPSAIRIRDNQRRSRARHKEYVQGLQKKLQDYERHGVEATLEMQQAARNVVIENSRLRMLLGYRGVSNDEIDKFLQTFPDQRATEAAKAAISSESAIGHQPTIAFPPKAPLQPLPRPSLSPVKTGHVVLVSQAPQENNTRKVVDAAVGINREVKKSGTSISGEPQEYHSAQRRQPQLLQRAQLPLPAISAPSPSVLPQDSPIDKLSVLANASVQTRLLRWEDEVHALTRGRPQCPVHLTMGPSLVTSIATTTTGSGLKIIYTSENEVSETTAICST